MAEQDSSIPNLDPVNIPLSGAEVFPVSQNGVTKKMRVDEIPTSGGQLDSNELAAVQNANAPTGVNPFATIADLGISGSWTPTFTYDGAIGAANIDAAKYSRTGNIVTCTITGGVSVDFSTLTTGNLDFSLPIVSANYETIGCGSIEAPNQVNGIIKSGGRFRLSSNDTSFSSSVSFYAIFQYEIS